MALQQTLVLGQPALWGAATQGFPGEISGQSQACPRQARPAGPIGVLTQATYTLSPACFGEGRTLHVGSPPGACVPGEREPGSQPSGSAGRQGREAHPSVWEKATLTSPCWVGVSIRSLPVSGRGNFKKGGSFTLNLLIHFTKRLMKP